MTILAQPESQNTFSGGHNVYNFGKGLPDLHYDEFS